jgi:thymidylate synthase (FAD)
MASSTRLYMNGTIRSWIHYLEIRANKESGTQLEHFLVANEIKEIFKLKLPIISTALGW